MILLAVSGTVAKEVKDLAEIRIRDPYIVADQSTGKYYMYAQMGNRADASDKGVEVYTSKDLKKWT